MARNDDLARDNLPHTSLRRTACRLETRRHHLGAHDREDTPHTRGFVRAFVLDK